MSENSISVCLNTQKGPLGIIRVRGGDAASFLHSQLTQDMLNLNVGAASLAAWCSAKGRMLATFWVLRARQDEFLLITSRNHLASIIKRLSLFVLRAKCQISDVSTDFSLAGVMQSADQAVLLAHTSERPPFPALQLQTQTDQQWALQLSRAAWKDAMWQRSVHICAQPPSESADAHSLSLWESLEVMSGIARIDAAVSDAFVPQMLNFESVGGVNFKKGCYPGQEVVARSQFRGSLKKKGFIVAGTEPMHAGQDIFDQGDTCQPCGLIAQAAQRPDGVYVGIAAIQTASAEAGRLCLQTQSEAKLRLEPLPYALLTDL